MDEKPLLSRPSMPPTGQYPVGTMHNQVPTTPSSNSQARAILKETPRVPRSDANATPITRVRPAIASEMNDEFITCSFDDFLAHYMPFAPSESYVLQFIDTSVALGDYVFTRDEDDPQRIVFTDYKRLPKGNVHEKAFYAHLEIIAREIDDYQHAPPRRGRNDFYFYNCPDDNIVGEISGQNNRIDACFRSGNGKLHIHQIAVAIEQKTTTNQTVKNNRQLVSMCVQLMNDDIRRMFMFGITIEGDKVCVFYHSRSHSAISEPFYFIEEPWRLVQVFMAFMYATEAELGYDPLVKHNSGGVYTYEIPSENGSRLFRTDKALAFFRSNNITGRTSRVWSVTEVDVTGDPVCGKSKFVLKDIWLEHGAKTEKEIQQAIFGDIEKFFKSDNSKLHKSLEKLRNSHAELVRSGRYREYFLTIATDYVGQTSKPVALNSWRPENTLISRPSTPERSCTSAKVVRTSVGVPRPISTPNSESPHREFVPKKQYRVVFEEECTALRDLRTLGEMVDALTSAVTALELLLGAGWVHRDISCGNLLVQYCEHGSQLKLADLEYAKRFPPAAGTETSTDPKTGTPYYMPTEILQQAYIYKPHDDAMYNSHESGEMEPIVDFEQILSTGNGKTSSGRTPTLSEHILHNFQHDLESLWWILLRVLTDFIPNPVANAWARQLFDNSIGKTSGPRFDAFHLGVDTKLKAVLPLHLSFTFGSLMEFLRVELRTNYTHFQKLDNVYCQFSYSPLHDRFRNLLTVLSKHRREEWASTSLGRNGLAEVEPLRARQKRKRLLDDEHSDYEPGARMASRSNLSNSGRQSGKGKRSKSGV